MKVLSIKRSEDCVRFNFTVVVEDGPIKIHVNALGELNTGCGPLKEVQMGHIDDTEWEKVLLSGKEVNVKEFRILYDKLFKGGIEKFENGIDKTAEEAVLAQFPRTLDKLNPRDVWTRVSKWLVQEEAQGGVVYGQKTNKPINYLNKVVRKWPVFQICKVLGVEGQEYDYFIDDSGKTTTRWKGTGYRVSDILAAMK